VLLKIHPLPILFPLFCGNPFPPLPLSFVEGGHWPGFGELIQGKDLPFSFFLSPYFSLLIYFPPTFRLEMHALGAYLLWNRGEVETT